MKIETRSKAGKVLAKHKGGKLKRKYSIKTVHEAAIRLASAGGLKGGPARAEALSPERRTEIATRAANIRWGNITAEE